MGTAAGRQLSPADALDDILDGRLGQDAVRQVVRNPLRNGLADLLHDQLADCRSGDLELLRTKFKPFRKLTAYYRLQRDPVDAATRLLAVSWFAQAKRGGPRVTVLASPADPAMPQLGRLVEPAYLASRIEELTGRRPGPGGRSVRTVRYRPGQRHVLQARLDGAHVFVKTDRDDSGARAVRVAGLVAETCPKDRPAAPVGYVADDSAALWWYTAGEPLSRLPT
ncbi:MAG: hypothetical protein ACRDQ0_19480, partial [Pseudonocardia sp.]